MTWCGTRCAVISDGAALTWTVIATLESGARSKSSASEITEVPGSSVTTLRREMPTPDRDRIDRAAARGSRKVAVINVTGPLPKAFERRRRTFFRRLKRARPDGAWRQ